MSGFEPEDGGSIPSEGTNKIKMKIFITAKPNSKIEKVEKTGEASFKVSVKAPPKENKANFAVMEAIAEYFKVPLSKIRLISGRTSKNKIIEIL